MSAANTRSNVTCRFLVAARWATTQLGLTTPNFRRSSTSTLTKGRRRLSTRSCRPATGPPRRQCLQLEEECTWLGGFRLSAGGAAFGRLHRAIPELHRASVN